ncbi:MAG: beta-lactamase family protein [Pyrinomonadaceae bacterium]|nr:beta-lactamase family protein [Pyrinomonadaceae bacterium]
MIKRTLTLLSLLVLLCNASVLAQKKQARQIVSKLMVEKNIPGISVSVIEDGKLIWSEGFGFADLEQNVKATPNTKFRIGSLSKLLTAAALARLHDKKVIGLDDSIYKYVPAFPKKKNDITVRQLAGHLGGIRHYGANEYVVTKRYENVDDSLKIFQESPLRNVPGTKYSYSTYGYTLLSAAIEGASKQDFLTNIQNEVFSPLSLNSTVADDNRRIIKNRTHFYSVGSDKEWVNAPYTDNSNRWAGGGFLSTSEDLVRFAEAHLKDGFLKPETRRILFTPQKTSDGKETIAGIAWRIARDDQGRIFYHHGGSSIGGRAYLLVYPQQKTAIAVLSNLTFARFGINEVSAILKPFDKE